MKTHDNCSFTRLSRIKFGNKALTFISRLMSLVWCGFFKNEIKYTRHLFFGREKWLLWIITGPQCDHNCRPSHARTTHRDTCSFFHWTKVNNTWSNTQKGNTMSCFSTLIVNRTYFDKLRGGISLNLTSVWLVPVWKEIRQSGVTSAVKMARPTKIKWMNGELKYNLKNLTVYVLITRHFKNVKYWPATQLFASGNFPQQKISLKLSINKIKCGYVCNLRRIRKLVQTFISHNHSSSSFIIIKLSFCHKLVTYCGQH